MATIVLIHGAFQGGWIFQSLAELLRGQGHTVLAPSLDGCAERRGALRPGITNETHGAEIADLLFFEDISDAILVGTSTGGIVMCAAAERARERIGKLVFVDAMAMMNGETPAIVIPGPPTLRTEAAHTEDAVVFERAALGDLLFAEFEPNYRKWIVDRSGDQPIATLHSPVHLPAFWEQAWDAVVIRCTQAPAPPLAHHRRAAEKLNARYYELDTGHYPMLSEPHGLARLIVEG